MIRDGVRAFLSEWDEFRPGRQSASRSSIRRRVLVLDHRAGRSKDEAASLIGAMRTRRGAWRRVSTSPTASWKHGSSCTSIPEGALADLGWRSRPCRRRTWSGCVRAMSSSSESTNQISICSIPDIQWPTRADLPDSTTHRGHDGGVAAFMVGVVEGILRAARGRRGADRRRRPCRRGVAAARAGAWQHPGSGHVLETHVLTLLDGKATEIHEYRKQDLMLSEPLAWRKSSATPVSLSATTVP